LALVIAFAGVGQASAVVRWERVVRSPSRYWLAAAIASDGATVALRVDTTPSSAVDVQVIRGSRRQLVSTGSRGGLWGDAAACADRRVALAWVTTSDRLYVAFRDVRGVVSRGRLVRVRARVNGPLGLVCLPDGRLAIAGEAGHRIWVGEGDVGGGGWREQLLGDRGVGISPPALTVLRDGGLVVAWSTQRAISQPSNVVVARRDPGLPWSAPVVVSGSLHRAMVTGNPVEVAAAADGGCVVAWLEEDGPDLGTLVTARFQGGRWGAPLEVARGADFPSLGTSDADVVLAWRTDRGVFAAYLGDLGWESQSTIASSSVTGPGTPLGTGLVIVGNRDGAVVVAWPSYRGAFAAMGTGGRAFGPPARLSRGKSRSARLALGSGVAVVAWNTEKPPLGPDPFFAVQARLPRVTTPAPGLSITPVTTSTVPAGTTTGLTATGPARRGLSDAAGFARPTLEALALILVAAGAWGLSRRMRR
jgi:hypothetical protein